MAWHHMAAAVALLILTAACTQHRADAVAAVTVATATLIHNSMPRPSSMPLQRPHRALLDLTAQTLETNFTAEHLASSGWMANLSNLISAGDLESFAKAQTAMAVALDLIGKETEEHKTATEETETAVDTMWIMFTGMLVFFMQAGFGILEAGTVRSKNTKNIMIKNVLDSSLSILLFWTFGNSIAFGESKAGGFYGWSAPVLGDTPADDFAGVFFSWTFAGTAATIVSGSIAERVTLHAYMGYTAVLTGLIYPVVCHWVWGGGFLAEMGVMDFAGSGVVHMVGGFAGMIGTMITGPRLGRFVDLKAYLKKGEDPDSGDDSDFDDEDNDDERDDAEGQIVTWYKAKDGGKRVVNQNDFDGYSLLFCAIGVFILWFGWYGFNPGSTLAMFTAASRRTASLAAINTTIAPASSAWTYVMWIYIRSRGNVISFSSTLNALLAGLVAITCPCAVVEPWAACVIGVIAAFVYGYSAQLLLKLEIDDPLEASPIHGFTGIWGLIAGGLFASDKLSAQAGFDHYGLLYGGDLLGIQMIFILVLLLWVGILTAAIFSALKACDKLRIPPALEEGGLDEYYHLNSAGNDVESLMKAVQRQEQKRQDGAWQIDPAGLTIGELIGKGGSGEVHKGMYLGQEVAIKKLRSLDADGPGSSETSSTFGTSASAGMMSAQHPSMKSSAVQPPMSSSVFSGTSSANKKSSTRSMAPSAVLKRRKRDFMEEARLLITLRHPNVAMFMGAVVNGPNLMIVSEWLVTSVYDYIHSKAVVLTYSMQIQMCRDVARCMEFLHESSPVILHKDLKSPNLLLDSNMVCKVADFGASSLRGTSVIGTSLWTAPEVLRGAVNTPQADVYSFGITMWEIFARDRPYRDTMEQIAAMMKLGTDGADAPKVILQTLNMAMSGSCRPDTSKSLKIPPEIVDLMQQCWSGDAEFRPTFALISPILTELSGAKYKDKYQPPETQNEDLINQMLPPKVAERLKKGLKVEPEEYAEVTILFSDIVGFTDMSSKMKPELVMDMLDRLYTAFDELTKQHGLFKVETIGDAYMVVAGIPEAKVDHTLRIARMGHGMIKAASQIEIDRNDPSMGNVNIRVGYHSGPVVASVVGSMNPRYCLFGDTVNMASRMESNSIVGKCHVSEATAALMKKQMGKKHEFSIVSCGMTTIKGKGTVETFFVEEATKIKSNQLPRMRGANDPSELLDGDAGTGGGAEVSETEPGVTLPGVPSEPSPRRRRANSNDSTPDEP